MFLRKIIKIVATRCHILRLKCTKFDFGCCSASDPAGKAHSAPPDLLAGLRGFTSKGRGGIQKGKEEREVASWLLGRIDAPVMRRLMPKRTGHVV